VNLRAKQRASFKQATEKKTEIREEKEAGSSQYHDPRISIQGAQRSRKQFKFIEPGKGWYCGNIWSCRHSRILLKGDEV